MKQITLLAGFLMVGLLSCKKENATALINNVVTSQGGNTKSLKLVVTGNPAAGGIQPFDVYYKPTHLSGNWEWIENCTSGTFEKNVKVQKDSTLMVGANGDLRTLFLFNIQIYEGDSLLTEHRKVCTFTNIYYTVE